VGHPHLSTTDGLAAEPGQVLLQFTPPSETHPGVWILSLRSNPGPPMSSNPSLSSFAPRTQFWPSEPFRCQSWSTLTCIPAPLTFGPSSKPSAQPTC
jgi:hypothetical protein